MEATGKLETFDNAKSFTPTELSKPVSKINEDNATNNLQRRTTITRFSPIPADNPTLRLASGAILAVKHVSIALTQYTHVPAVSTSMTSILDAMGQAMSASGGRAAGKWITSDTYLQLVIDYKSGTTSSPNLTALEWQTMVWAMYRKLVQVNSLANRITCVVSIGNKGYEFIMTALGN
ncbi:hypothetical protein NQ176_g3754 [Zarea fungicola]|uniref:Uncharacterized protein n=1 Tax=Zarea fungicola TaxID=93591 RepID=A0ACC1NIX4_9HYPO|nr:hypothetical protein NQ176_g3754 [Lecanicillium fungicola]